VREQHPGQQLALSSATTLPQQHDPFQIVPERRCVLNKLVFLIHPLLRTPPMGGGCAAGSLPPSHYLKLGPAVRCRSPPEFPFRFIWVLGLSTRYLCANDPTPCTCKTNYLRILVLFNTFFHFRLNKCSQDVLAPTAECLCLQREGPFGHLVSEASASLLVPSDFGLRGKLEKSS
jgi:hypothetical protein